MFALIQTLVSTLRLSFFAISILHLNRKTHYHVHEINLACFDPDSDFNLEAEAEKRKPTISSIDALDNDRMMEKRRAENLLSIFEGEPETGKDQLIKAQLMTSLTPSAEIKMPEKEGKYFYRPI